MLKIRVNNVIGLPAGQLRPRWQTVNPVVRPDRTMAASSMATVRRCGRAGSRFSYNDSRSRRQIGFFLTWANDTRRQNEHNLTRWNEELAWQWYEQPHACDDRYDRPDPSR